MTKAKPPVMAARRDATWARDGGPGYAQRFHIIVDGCMSACGKHVLLDEDAEPAEDIAQADRCQMPGCKVRWPAVATAERKA